MIACFLSNISAKYYKNPSMLSRVIAKNVGDVFWDTVYIMMYIWQLHAMSANVRRESPVNVSDREEFVAENIVFLHCGAKNCTILFLQ